MSATNPKTARSRLPPASEPSELPAIPASVRRIPAELLPKFAAAVHIAMRDRGVTRTALHRRVDIDPMKLGLVVGGQVVPTVAEAELICAAAGLDAAEFIG